MYRLPAYKVMLVRERSVPAQSRTVRTPSDAAAVLRKYIGDADREHLVVLCLDIRHRVVGIHTVSVGTLTASPAHPREVFKAAILVNAAAIILGHNHPSGDPEPSRADLGMTDTIARAGRVLGIPLMDHIVVGEDSYTSLRERGNVPEPAVAGSGDDANDHAIPDRPG